MMSKKGQAAMEFLMTYGWAILIAIIAIAALIAFGVFNPPVQEVCTGSGGLGAIINGVTCAPDTIYVKTGQDVNVTLDNSLGTNVSLTSMTYAIKRNAGSTACTATGTVSDVHMLASSIQTLTITGCDAATAGKPYEATITGTFTDYTNTYPFSFKFIKKASS